MRYAMRSLFTLVVLLALTTPAVAQSVIDPPPIFTRSVSLSGPRFGFTSLSPGVVDKLAEHDIHVKPFISQFGWQFEREFFNRGNGVAAITEVVALVGGLEQSVVLPSVTWMVGLRTAQGAEFGIGPNITPAGAALAIAAGVTFRSGSLNIPMTFAVVPSKSGMRVSVLTGFTLRRR